MHAGSPQESPSGLPDDVFRLVFDRTAVPFVVVDRAGTIVEVSASIGTLVGWAPKEVIGRSIAEFVEPDAAGPAFAALAEIDSPERMRRALPIVFPIRSSDGRHRHVEVAAIPLHDARVDVGAGNLVALRLRSWEAERHLSSFVRGMVSGAPLGDALAHLTRSLAESMEGVGAAVHHGFDGTSFHAVEGSWPGAASLPLAGSPWVEALGCDDVVEVVPSAPALEEVGAAAGWLMAVHPGSGLPPAVLSLWRGIAGGPFLGHRQALAQACDFVELAIVRAAEHERLVQLARHDPLTGVANRSTFRDLLAAALARGERDLAVGFCDLDDFKAVNDRHGHGVGDDVLVEVVARLRGCLRAGDEIARMGGDEFTVLWRNIPGPDAADAVAARLVAAGDEVLAVPGGGDVRIGISVGVALSRPDDTAETLLAAADEALYRSKQAGGRRATLRAAG